MCWYEICIIFAAITIFIKDMKKTLFALVALMAVMTVQAQSICGTWRMMQPVVETGDDGSFQAMTGTYTFNDDGTFHYALELTEASEPAPTMAMEIAALIEMKGAYTLEGDQLTLTPDLDTYKAEILSLSMNGKVTDNPMVTNQIKGMLNSAEFKSQFSSAETNTVKIGDSSLEMNDGEHTLNFVRFATINN